MVEQNKIPKLLLRYLKYLYAVRYLSLNTIKAYYYDLLGFFMFLKNYKKMNLPIECFNIFIFISIKTEDIIAFLVSDYYKFNNSPYTRKRKISAIRGFFTYIFSLYPSDEKRINPTDKINPIINMVRLPKYLTLEQGIAIQNAFTLKNSRNPIRDNTIISLFLATGMRVSELVNIDVSDINFDDKSINIVGKGNKERIVYFSEKCKEKLLKYLFIRNKKTVGTEDALFINNRNKRLTVYSVEQICQRAYKAIGLADRGYTVHTLRHTTAVMIYKETEDIVLVKHILGHSDITSTEIYTHVYNKALKAASERHPLNFAA